MEDNKELNNEEFIWALVLMLLFQTEESKELFLKYAAKEKPMEVIEKN